MFFYQEGLAGDSFAKWHPPIGVAERSSKFLNRCAVIDSEMSLDGESLASHVHRHDEALGSTCMLSAQRQPAQIAAIVAAARECRTRPGSMCTLADSRPTSPRRPSPAPSAAWRRASQDRDRRAPAWDLLG